MKAKIYAICRISLRLITILFLAALITGGADLSFANERNIYEVVAVNNTSKITTVFQVFADTERDARENVALNGWKILSLRQVTYRQTSAVPVQVGDGPVVYMDIAPQQPDNTTARKDNATPRLSDDQMIDSLLGAPTPNASLGRGDAGQAPMRGDVDILSMTPDSDQLEYLYTIYFDLGIITPNMSAADNATLARLPKEGTYYMFGHADNVSVAPNLLFKDNYELSFKRAEAVKGLMRANGINPAKLITVGLGALYPAVRNRSSADGTLQNRRVEIYGLRTAE